MREMCVGIAARSQDRKNSAKPIAARRGLRTPINKSRKDRVDRSAGREFREQSARDVQIGLSLARESPLFFEFDRERELHRKSLEARQRQRSVFAPRAS